MSNVSDSYLSLLEPRAAKAVAIVEANRWKIFRDSQGRLSFSIPSTRKPGLYYRATDNACTCPDLVYRPWVVCKHMEAVRLVITEGEAF